MQNETLRKPKEQFDIIRDMSEPHPRKLWYAKQPTEGVDWRTRAMRMVDSVVTDAVSYMAAEYPLSNTIVVCETPNNWFCEKGQASKDSEDVQKLYWFVGAIVSSFSSLDKENMRVSSIYTVVPSAWKGQTPKRIMVKRAGEYLQRFGKPVPSPFPDDVAEALLLGRRFAELVLPKTELPSGWARIWTTLPDSSSVSMKSWNL